jgi:hypothetical protein
MVHAHLQPGGFAIFLSQDWTWCYIIYCRTGRGGTRDGAYIQWDWGAVHRPGPLEHMHAAACSCACATAGGQGAAVAWGMNRLRRLALPPSPVWAPPLRCWRGVGSAQPARLPLFVADQGLLGLNGIWRHDWPWGDWLSRSRAVVEWQNVSLRGFGALWQFHWSVVGRH